MKLINEPESIDLDESYNKNKDKTDSDSLIGDNFYESKTVSIFYDDFQGIEWPVGKQYKQDIHNPLDPVVGIAMSDLPGNIFYNDDN